MTLVNPKICTLLLISFFNLALAQGPLSDDPNGDLILNYLLEHRATWGLSDSDLTDLTVASSHTDERTEITHVYVQQHFDQILVYNAIATIGIKNGKVFSAMNTLVPNMAALVNSTTPSLLPAHAILKTIDHFQLEMPNDIQYIANSGNDFTFSSESLSDNTIPVTLVLYPHNGTLRLSWDLHIELKNDNHWWSARVDAITGEILDTNDLVLNCEFHTPSASTVSKQPQFELFNDQRNMSADGSRYNVYALPAESPNHGPRQLITDPANLEASPFGWHDTDGVDGAEYTITRGNNVFAYEDSDGTNNPGYSPDGGANLEFDFPINLSGQANSYYDASITNLFYINNMMHDIWYNYGFDEVSGNFQQNNYGNGGAPTDYVNAEAQDGSGTNNANFATPPDGQSGRMQMFLWSPSTAPEILTIPSGSLAGTYSGIPAAFGGAVPTDVPISGSLVLAIDETTPDPYDACEEIQNGAALSGNIAVIKRGVCEFGFKVLAAENLGAIAVIIINNVPGNPITMAPGADGGSVTIPSIMISETDGAALIAALEAGESITGDIINMGPYSRDGDLDNGIVAHEYGHGISIRLAGGANNVGCLNNAEQMGEGWSDWFGLMLTMEAGDLGSDISGIGTFAIGQETDGNGIRPAPYSTDFGVNNHTYGSTNNTASISEPHGIGFVWATMLWDLTWAYVDKYGFDPDLYNGTGGNNKVMALVIEGLKLQACNPGFVNGRDAILAADTAITGGTDQCMIWEVFANRGLGYNASQGLSISRTDQVEDFTMPPSDDPTLVNCVLSNNNPEFESIKIFPNPTNDVLRIQNTNQIGKARLVLTDLNGRVVWKKDGILDANVNIDVSKMTSGLYVLSIDNGTTRHTRKIIIQ